MRGPRSSGPGTIAELVRLPAVLTVPATASSGRRSRAGRAVARARSASASARRCSTWRDGPQRLRRPRSSTRRSAPAGRCPRGACGRGSRWVWRGCSRRRASRCRGLAGGPARRRALALAGTVWAYDLVLKGTPAGPPAMADGALLDVLVGAAPTARSALPAATIVGAHTLAVTLVSREEAARRSPWPGRGALGRSRRRVRGGRQLRGRPRSGPSGAPGTRACWRRTSRASAQRPRRATREPTAANVQRVVGAGILGLLPLQAALPRRLQGNGRGRGGHERRGPSRATCPAAGRSREPQARLRDERPRPTTASTTRSRCSPTAGTTASR